MITTKTKGSKRYLSSSFFDDIRLLRKSRFDTDYRDLKMNTSFDVNRLQQAYLVQQIILWRKGCIELSDYVSKTPIDQLKNTSTVYMGEDWVEETENIVEEKVSKEIADPDN